MISTLAARRSLLVCAFLASSVFAGSARAQGLNLAGSIGGVSYAVERQGVNLFAGEGAHFISLNNFDPTRPVLRDRLRLGDMVRAIEISGSRAYVAASGAGVYVIDISNPSALVIEGQYDTPGTAMGLLLIGTTAYVADSESGLQIIDVSNPTAPALIASENTTGRAFGIAINGPIAYIADEAAGIQVISVANPANPIFIRTVLVPGRAFDVILSGTTAYVASGTAGLQVLNVANAALPTIQTSLDTPGTAFRVVQAGARLFIADQESGIQVVDLPTPTTPAIAGSYDSSDAAYGITTDGVTASVADLRGGIQNVNIVVPVSTQVGNFETVTDSREVASNGTIAAVADGVRGLKVLNVSIPGFPFHTASIPTGSGAVQDVEIQGTTAYVAAGSDGFLIVDLANPFSPSVIGSFAFPSSGVTIEGIRAYVTRDDPIAGEIIALDISDPAMPTFLDNFAQGDTGRWDDVVANGMGILYVAGNSDGIQLIQFSILVGFTGGTRVDTTGESRGIELHGDVLYLADYTSGFRIYDVTNIFAPVQTGAFNTAGLTHDVAVMDDLGFLADGAVGVQLMNVNSPQFPTLIDTLDTPGTAIGVSVAGSFAFFADQDGGVGILSGGLPPVPPILGSPGDVIIGDLEFATASATMTNTFVFPNAFDLRAISIDNSTPDSDIKWSFTGGGGKILINGVGPLDPSLAGIGADDPTAPRIANRIDLNNNDPEGQDGSAFTVTFRNADLSPIGGPNIDPVTPGILPAETRTITLFASDCTTFGAMSIIVYTANDTSDSLSGSGFTPVGGNDFTVEGDVGGDWIGGVAGGIGSTSIGSAGLCMTVPLLGDNTVLWVSPERYVELVDNTLYRVRVAATTNQTATDAIPLWNVNYDNFTTSGFGNTYGGTAWFLDVDGGAQGIGRANGRTSFDVFITPNAVQLQPWRGTIDFADSAFEPTADFFNDFRLILRIQDIGSAPIVANADVGTICIGSVRIDSIPIDNLPVDSTLFSTPISTATHFPETFGQSGSGGIATIDDLTNTAHYELNVNGDRKTLGPNDLTEVNLAIRLYPVIWEGDALYRGKLDVRSNIDLDGLGPGNGVTEGLDSVDAITMLFDTTNSELGQFSWTTRGAPGNMNKAASPRLPANVGGQRQTYLSYFYGQNATSSMTPFANRLRFMGDFANALELFNVSGKDAFAAEDLIVEKMLLP